MPGGSDYGYGPIYGYGPLYGSTTTEADPASGYTHTHAVYADRYGAYSSTFDEVRGPASDHSYHRVDSYAAGVYRTDILDTTTPLDGAYASSGTRYTGTYDSLAHVRTTDDVSFSPTSSYSAFHRNDYAAGTAVASYDARWLYAGGYYEYTRTTYAGPEAETETVAGGYHYTG